MNRDTEINKWINNQISSLMISYFLNCRNSDRLSPNDKGSVIFSQLWKISHSCYHQSHIYSSKTLVITLWKIYRRPYVINFKTINPETPQLYVTDLLKVNRSCMSYFLKLSLIQVVSWQRSHNFYHCFLLRALTS